MVAVLILAAVATATPTPTTTPKLTQRRAEMETTVAQWPGWVSAVVSYVVPALVTGLLGFLGGQRLERFKARTQLRGQGMKDVTDGLNEVESVAGDLMVRLEIVTVNDVFVLTKSVATEEQSRLETEVLRIRELAGRLRRYPELSRLAEEFGLRASSVVHAAERVQAGVEPGEITRARHHLPELFEKLIAEKDRALASIF